MWARYIELTLGLWLAGSPFVLHHGATRWLWAHDLSVGALIGILALLSHVSRFSRSHLLLLIVAAWLVGFGWWHARAYPMGAPAAFQNWIATGLLLMLFAIVPNQAFRPPR